MMRSQGNLPLLSLDVCLSKGGEIALAHTAVNKPLRNPIY